MLAAIAILIALRARDKTGKGQYIDISMAHGALWLLIPFTSEYFMTGKAPERGRHS
jgi:crotonobetainyl-CoA:carnitine CoA-transferase CaiB-like acyl-CoA transferase